jgi:hypothetical protein
MAGAGRCRGLGLVKKRDKDLVGRLITSYCPLSLSTEASRCCAHSVCWPSPSPAIG